MLQYPSRRADGFAAGFAAAAVTASALVAVDAPIRAGAIMVAAVAVHIVLSTAAGSRGLDRLLRRSGENVPGEAGQEEGGADHFQRRPEH